MTPMNQIFPDYDRIKSYIKPLDINGLHGRMMQLPSTTDKKREILLIYGHHGSIERQYGLADDLRQYGNVTIADLPGCGGMDSFYKIGMKPTLDNMADYLATFIKLRYRNKKVTIMGMSLGFVIATRMLQRYPEMSKKVELFISMVGFTRHDDSKVPKKAVFIYKLLGKTFRHKLTAGFFYNVFLHPAVIRTFYAKTPNAKKKFSHLSREDFKRGMDFEVVLWRTNDVRTYMEMLLAMIDLDNCKKQINLPVYHVGVEGDQYFDNTIVEQHMRVIFTDYTGFNAVLPNHAPSVVATKEEAAPLLPKGLRKVLA